MNKTRKYLALFVASICLSLQAWAETFSVANTEGVFISYETTSETTVRVIKGESNYAGNVVIPTSVSYNEVEYTVDAIGEYAFFECPNLESVEIPNSVQTIGGRAFENCSALASVTIGESVTRIGYDAFKRSGLTSVVLPNSLEYIDYHAFDGCANLEYVSLGLSIQTIRENVFQGCYNLATVNVGSISSLMNIEFTNNDSNPLTKAEHLYLNGEEVTELVIPDGVTEIPANFFSGLTGITSVVIPGSVTYIGDNAFSGCTSLASVTFPDSPFTLGQNVFANTAFLNNAEDGVIYVGNIVYGYQGSMPENASIVIKEGTTAIVENAFLNCTGLTSIEVPATVTYIGKNAFAGTTWYETQPDGPIYINKVFYKYKGTMALNSEYEVADGTVSISGEAFKGYTQLSKLVLPNSLTTIGEQAFHGCLGLADLSIGEGLTYTGNDAFGGCSNLNNIYVPNVAQLFFLSSGSGQSNPFALARHLFVNDEELTELVIPDGVEELNDGFFYNFGKNVTSVTIPNSVTKIGGSAFKDWTNLAQVTFGESLKAIGDWAFAGCSALTRIDLPNSLESIGGDAFRDCSNLSYITLGDSLKTIGDWAFNGCNSLNTVNIPKVDILFSDNSFAYEGNPFSKASTLHVNGEEITELVIPDGVEEIKGGFFYNFGENVTSVTLPNSVKNIGNSAFSNWTNLSEVTFGDSLKKIGEGVFQGCTALESIIIPNSVTTIEDRVFEGCTKLSSITLGDSVSFIGWDAFNGCDSLQRVEVTDAAAYFAINFESDSSNPARIAKCLYCDGKLVTEYIMPYGATVVEHNLIAGYEDFITSIKFANSVETIGNWVFNENQSLTKITLPNSVKNIKERAFGSCHNLRTIIWGDSVATVGYHAFYDCDSIKEVHINSLANWLNIEFMDYHSNPITKAKQFYFDNENITELIIPDGCDKIPSYAFCGAKGITSAIIPNSVKSIGAESFRDCSSLSTITLGDSVAFIGYDAFNGCDSLQRVEVTNLDAWYAIQFENDKANPLTLAHHLYHNGEEVTGLHFPDGIAEINEGFFKGYENVTSVVLPNSVKRIGDRAFSNLINLKSVTLGDSLKTIGTAAFQGCTALESIVIPNSVTSFARDVFHGCSNLASVTLGNSLQTIGGGSFWECTRLDSIIIPNSVTTIEDRVFEGCTKLSYITLGDSLKTIGDWAFNGCDSLNTVNVSKLDIFFNDYSFAYEGNPFSKASTLHVNGKEITELVIPDGVEEIRGGFFYNFGKNVTSVTIPNSVKNIGGRAFPDWTNLSEVTFGESLETIGDGAFQGCTALESIVIPNSVTTIDGGVFEGCTKLSSITLGDSVKSIGLYAFNGCDKLSKVNVTNMANFCNIEFALHNSSGGSSNPLWIAKHLYLNDEKVTDLVIPNEVERIANCVFAGSDIISVSIPNSVHVIGDYAFKDCSSLTSVVIGDSVTTIGADAFWACHELSYISLGESLDSIAEHAFYACDSLIVNVTKIETLFKDYKFGSWASNPFSCSIELCLNDEPIVNLEVPNTVTKIPGGIFSGRNITSVTIPNSVKIIENGAFTNCSALTSIDIPNSVKVIGDAAFENCTELSMLSLGSSLDSIGVRAFGGCKALNSLEIPNSVTSIQQGAFYDCYNLKSITLGTSITSIGKSAFGNIGAWTSDTKVFFPNIEWIFDVLIEHEGNHDLFSKNLFVGQQPLSVLTIPDNVKDAPILPLFYNSCITSLNTGNGLKTLPEGESRNITQVTLGSNVTKVEAEFPKAYIVLSNNATPPVITEKTFPKCMFDNGAEGVVVLLNANDQKAYSKAKVWEGMQMSNQSNQVAVQVSAPGSIGTDLALGLRMPVAKVVGLTVSGEINEQDIMQMNKNMMSLLYLDLSDAIVDSIPDDAFNGKQQLLSLVLPKTTKVVGNSAFKGCNGIEELQMPMDVTEIGDEAFTGTSIRSMDFNYALKKIGNRAFANTPLKEISFQNKVESIGNEAFYGCNLEQELLFSETLRSIGDRAFDGQRGISGHLTIPESVASVGEGAFRGTSISTVFISGKMTTLESSVFANCNLLDVVYIPDNITNINSSAFQNCSSLKNLRLSQNIEEIGSEAFRAIPIRSVNVPENAKTLKSYSFADCSNLRFVTLPSTMTSLEEGVFSGCRQLMNLTTKALTPPEVKPNTFRGVNTDKCIISMPTVSIEAYITAPYWGRFMEMRNDIAVETEGKGSISFVSGDTEEDDDAASARTTRAGNATETMEDEITLVDDGSSLYVPQNGVVRFHITPAEGETILSATFDGVDIISQIVDGVFVTTADKLSSKLEVNFSQVTKTSQLITWEQSFEPLMVGDKVALSATASSGLPVTFDFADENSKECASLSNNTLTITKSGVIAIIALQKGDDEYASVATEMKYIRAYEYGDANADMEINSADLATAVDYAIGNNPKEFLFKAADVNKDSNVNVADVSGVVDIVLSAPATTDDVNGNAREIAINNNVLSVLDGNRLNFYVTQEKESFLTFQCDVRITDDSMLELDIAGNPIVSISNNMGTKNHIAVARLLTDGYIRVLVYSTDNTPIPNNYSFALHIGHELNESDIEISNAGYSYRDNGQITYGSLNSGVVTGLDNVTGNIDQTDIKVNGNTISFNSTTDCLMPVVSVNGMTYMLNVKAGYNEFTINKGVYVIGKNKVIIK